jgi:hypothetical protein
VISFVPGVIPFEGESITLVAEIPCQGIDALIDRQVKNLPLSGVTAIVYENAVGS